MQLESHNHQIIVIGTSSGGLAALREFLAELPSDLNAAVFVTMHIGDQPSVLPTLLTQTSPLPIGFAVNEERVQMGRVRFLDQQILVKQKAEPIIWPGGDVHCTGLLCKQPTVSDNGDLTTAIGANAPGCKVFWAVLDLDNLNEARESLRIREGVPQDREDGIGSFVVGATAEGVIAEWAIHRQLDAVIWTRLPPRFGGVEGLVPAAEDAVAYLAGLSGEEREHARDYIKNVPSQIDTPYRRQIMTGLGWY